MAPKRIRIELFPNYSRRNFHVTAQISAERLYGGFLGADRQDPFRVLTFGGERVEFSEDTKQTVLRFYDIDGVDAVGVNSNTVEITRQPAYDWDDFQDEVISTIEQIVGWEHSEVEIRYFYNGKVYAEAKEPLSQIEADKMRYKREAERLDF